MLIACEIDDLSPWIQIGVIKNMLGESLNMLEHLQNALKL